MQYNDLKPRKYNSLSTIAGDALNPSSNLFWARTSKVGPCFKTTVVPS